MAQPSGALGVADAVGWRRLAQPTPHGWTAAEATPRLQALTPPTNDPDPKALAWYGLLLRPGPQQADQRWRRLVTGRPVRAVTIALLACGSARLTAPGFTALRLIGDNASWPRRAAVRRWIRQPNRQVKQGAAMGVRLVVCHLPSKSPWLTPLEPTWVRGKRAVSEPDLLLTADDLEARLYASYSGIPEAQLVMPQKVA